MKNYKSTTERFLEAAGKTGDIMLRLAYQKQMIMDGLLTDREIDRLADRVLQRISLTVDASKVIQAIDEIQEKLDELEGKK